MIGLELEGLKYNLCDPRNYRKSRRSFIEFLVFHYDGNVGATDENNGEYFANNDTNDTSAGYFVDEDSVTQSVPDNACAFHCGAATYVHPYCRNDNSIGIEMCSDKDADGNYIITEATVANAIRLGKFLMRLYGVKIDCVLRHFDVTGKNCPEPWVRNPELWEDFKKRLASTDVVEEDEEMGELYEKLSDIPNAYGFQIIIEKLMNAKIINGDGSDSIGNNDNINLYDSQVRMFVIMYRGGAFDRKLKAVGMEPAVAD